MNSQHLDVDQAFSRLSVSLSLGHLTVADFFERVGSGFTHCGTPTEAISCDELLNWHLASNAHVHEFSGVSRPLLFKFSKGLCGKVVVHYKSHCDKQQWKGGDQVFKVPMPRTTSSAYDWPFVPVDTTLLLSNMTKLAPYVPELQRAHMLSSWAAFANAEDAAAASMCRETCRCARLPKLQTQPFTNSRRCSKRATRHSLAKMSPVPKKRNLPNCALKNAQPAVPVIHMCLVAMRRVAGVAPTTASGGYSDVAP